jgi:predicted transcriptional regulator
MTPTQNHLTILRLIKAMGSTIHEGKFIDRLMKESNAPPSLHQAESRINDLLNGGMLIIKPGTKLKIYELTDKALAFLK